MNHRETSAWSLEGGYLDNEMIDTFPHHAMTSGVYGGLTLYIGVDEKDLDTACNIAIQGLQVSTSTVRKVFGS